MESTTAAALLSLLMILSIFVYVAVIVLIYLLIWKLKRYIKRGTEELKEDIQLIRKYLSNTENILSGIESIMDPTERGEKK